MEVTAVREGDVLVAGTGNRIDSTNAREFHTALEDVIEAEDRVVILDLANLSYISSAGLRVILMAARSLKKRDAALAVCSLTEPVLEVFEISGFDQIISAYPSRTEAIAALAG